MRAVLKYPGAKWQIAPWIVAQMPAHTRYLEPFFGSGAVLFAKPPAAYEMVNDISGEVVNLFRVLREHGDALAALIEATPWAREEWEAAAAPADDPLERARRFLTYCWQSYGRGTPEMPTGWRGRVGSLTAWRALPGALVLVIERLRAVQIECRPALDVITRHHAEDVLIYADPPYPLGLRRRFYGHEMTDAEHAALLDALDAHPGPVALSGYHCALYDERLAHWRAVEKAVVVEQGQRRTEVLWLNPKITSNAHSLF